MKSSNKMKQLSLILQEMVVPLRDLDRLSQLPLFRVEVWMGNELMDESSDIIAVSNKNEQSLKLQIRSANFRFKTEQLFGKRKIARLTIKLFRESIYSKQEELVDEFKIVLSWYSYEYSWQLRHQWKQHSVGSLRCSFLYYEVHCFYDECGSLKALSNKTDLNNLPKLPRHQKNDYDIDEDEKIDHIDELLGFKKQSVRYLPLQSMQMDDLHSQKTFVSTKKLQPIYREDCRCNNDMAIKLDKSFVDVEIQSVQSSTFEQTEKLVSKITKIEVFLFYVFIGLGLWSISYLMSPKIRI